MPQVPKRDPAAASFFSGLYVPEHLPKDLDLNKFVIDPDAEEKRVQDSVALKQVQLPSDRTPLTPAEAELVDKQIAQLLDKLADTRERILRARNAIEKQVAPGGGKELSFTLDISKKRSLKRAIAVVFGLKTDTITYSMYKQCVELKRELEADDAAQYVSGDWED